MLAVFAFNLRSYSMACVEPMPDPVMFCCPHSVPNLDYATTLDSVSTDLPVTGFIHFFFHQWFPMTFL